MKRFLVTLQVIMLFVFSGTAFGKDSVKIDYPSKRPSFLGYVDNEFIIVLKEEAVAIAQKGGTKDNALAGMANIGGLVKKFNVSRIKPQFPGAFDNYRAKSNNSKSPSIKSACRKLVRYYKVKFKHGKLEEVMDAFRNHPMVAQVEPIGVHAAYEIPNDPNYYDQWAYWDSYGIDAEAAWDKETGNDSVVVGILDTGVRYSHHDLGRNNDLPLTPDNPINNGNIWVNPGEIPGNNVDDDSNGFIDDTIGWDFVEDTFDPFYIYTCIDQDCGISDNDPDDGEGHGTHVAGIVGAISNNANSVAGVAGGFSDGTASGPGNGVKLMPLRVGWRVIDFFGYTGGVVRMDYLAQAMDYVSEQVEKGNKVAAINLSCGTSNTGGIEAAVDSLLAHDVLIVVAAGNNGEAVTSYVASRGDCLTVAANDRDGHGPSWTNHGELVDIAAPGVDILSTWANPDDPDPDHHYTYSMSGTSMAAPHVCGIAALLRSFNPFLTGPEAFQLIINNTLPYNDSRYLGSGIANAGLAIDAASIIILQNRTIGTGICRGGILLEADPNVTIERDATVIFEVSDSILAGHNFTIEENADVTFKAASITAENYFIIKAGTKVSFEALDSITIGPHFIIESGAEVTFRAGHLITIWPDFIAREGCIFEAAIL